VGSREKGYEQHGEIKL